MPRTILLLTVASVTETAKSLYHLVVNATLLPPANEVCEGYVFTRVCHSVHGGVCLSACWVTPQEAGTPPPRSRHTPQEQTPPRPRADTPLSRHPPEQAPPQEQTTLPPSPGSSVCWEIRPTNGRYTSYWNAFLFIFVSDVLHLKLL